MLNPWVRTDKEFYEVFKFFLNRNPSRVLEWGSGGSTTIYPYFIPNLSIWISIEADLSWAKTVRQHLPADRLVDLREAPPLIGTPTKFIPGEPLDIWLSHPNFFSYVRYPDRFEMTFDVIIIDGHVRYDTLLQSRKYSHKETLILHHDSYDGVHAANISKVPNLIEVDSFETYRVFKHENLNSN